MTQAITAKPRAAEMPETVLRPTTREFSQKFVKNSSEQQNIVKKYKEKSENLPFCPIGSASLIAIGLWQFKLATWLRVYNYVKGRKQLPI
jgi:hypothetical protein